MALGKRSAHTGIGTCRHFLGFVVGDGGFASLGKYPLQKSLHRAFLLIFDLSRIGCTGGRCNAKAALAEFFNLIHRLVSTLHKEFQIFP